MLGLAGGVYLGWALGANDAANFFGTAVGSGVISFRRASALCALAVLAGAALQGQAGIQTLSGLTEQTMTTLIIVSVSAAITITMMTIFGLPISTSQAVVGAIIGIGIATRNLSTSGLAKVVVSWLVTPLGSMFFAVLFFTILRYVSRHMRMGILARDKLLWTGLVVVGTYGSYALGANNVANATGIYSGVVPGLNDFHLAVIGGGAIGLGVITFSRRVMESVGKRLMRLDAFTAFIAVSSMAATVHIFAVIGVPVSTSQALVGAILGVGILRGLQNLKARMLLNFSIGWICTPLISFVLSAAASAIWAVG